MRSEYLHNLLSGLRHPDRESCALPRQRSHLAYAPAGQRDGLMAQGPPQPGWTRSVKATGQAVVAPEPDRTDSGTGPAERTGMPHVCPTADIGRGLAAIWTTAPLEQARRVQGQPEVRVTVKPQEKNATIAAYLMDCDPATGKAAVITHARCTLTNQRGGQPPPWPSPCSPPHCVLARRRQLQLTIDTHDRFFGDASTAPSAIEITSPQGAESCIDIPISTLG